MTPKNARSTGDCASLEQTPLPAELNDKIMEYWVAVNYPNIRVRSCKDVEAGVEEIKDICQDARPWNDTERSIKTALFTSAAFRLNISFVDQTDGTAHARVPAAVSELVPRIKKRELMFLVTPKQPDNIYPDGSPFVQAIKGMASLNQHFGHLDTLSIHLLFNADEAREEHVRSGAWAVGAMRHPPGIYSIGGGGGGGTGFFRYDSLSHVYS